MILGSIPHNFTHYWINKFPRLLSHSYHALERCSHEPSFQYYYAQNGVFSKPEYFLAAFPVEDTISANTNWREAKTAGAPVETLNWRSSPIVPPGSTTPKKNVNKRGTYNFKVATSEDGTAAGAAVPTAGAVKKRKFYPRRD